MRAASTCAKPTALAAGVTTTCTSGGVLDVTACGFGCGDGYTLSGTTASICLADSGASTATYQGHSAVTCTEKTCANDGSGSAPECGDNASCSDDGIGFTCKCTTGFEGTDILNSQADCTDINECSQQPCQNGATCENLINGFVCHCAVNHFGVHCIETHDDCDDAVRLELCGSGICINLERTLEDAPAYTCNCEAGWNHPVGEKECTVATLCPETSTGDSVPDGCVCNSGYAGVVDATTEFPFFESTCVEKTCADGGSGSEPVCGDNAVCSEDADGYTCICYDGYIGLSSSNAEATCMGRYN